MTTNSAGSGPDRPRVPGIGRVIAVASGKGGVGKSTVALNLALALRARGQRVALLDADVYGPNIPLMLGVRRRPRVDERDALFSMGSREPSFDRLVPLQRHGLAMLSLALLVGEDQYLLPGNAAFAGILVHQLLTESAWGDRDYLVIDLPPGTGEPLVTLLARVRLDGVVLVTTPHTTAIIDTLRSWQLFREHGVPILGRVENMAYLVCPHCGEPIEMATSDDLPVTDLDSVPLLSRLPIDAAVGRATNLGRSVVLTDPDGVVAQAFLDLADRIHGPGAPSE